MKAFRTNGYNVFLNEDVDDDINTISDKCRAIGVALKRCTSLVAVIDNEYVDSNFCRNELYMAEAQNKVIIPILINANELYKREDSTWHGLKYCLAMLNKIKCENSSILQDDSFIAEILKVNFEFFF